MTRSCGPPSAPNGRRSRVAEAQRAAVGATIAQTESLLERLVVRAPIAGAILQVNVRPGEWVAANLAAPPLVLGDITELQVRAEDGKSDPLVGIVTLTYMVTYQTSLTAPDIVFVRSANLPLTPAAEHLSDLMRRYADA